MKQVAAGANYTTVEVDTAEVVKFSFASTFLSVKVIEGDITVALTDTAQAGDDGTITVSEGETEMFNHYRMNVDTYYLTGSGKAVLHASNMVEVNPFSGKSKGGDGGQYSGTYTPEGAVAVTPTTGTVTGVSANGTLPAVTYDAANEELTFTEGTLPTLDTDKSFVTGATAEFTGTQAIITVQ